MSSRLTAPYWRIREALDAWRGRQTVRHIARLMRRCDVLYVHEHEGEGPVYVVRRVDADTNHDHIEGAKRPKRSISGGMET